MLYVLVYMSIVLEQSYDSETRITFSVFRHVTSKTRKNVTFLDFEKKTS